MKEIAESIEDRIFSKNMDFEQLSFEVFQFQYKNNTVYQKYVDMIGIDTTKINQIKDIPFLPIQLFKSHKIATTSFHPQAVFESSGTTGSINSKHFVKNIELYKKSFLQCFYQFYGNPKDWCIIGLLPSYLERQSSSLVFMVNQLITESRHEKSGFYLNEFKKLAQTLKILEATSQKTLLIGVTFALLDFAEQYAMPLKTTTIMETGGMKGRREEMVRSQVHAVLKHSFGVQSVHSEYGMTELLSQAYSQGEGVFEAPQWMKILIRDEDDPLSVHSSVESNKLRGKINIIDLANIYSCSFIATDDLGYLYENGAFEVLGRADNSDIRGCSQLVL
ncbi:MAG TPA: acyl transferase [Niabella sp.]|nr:acyl transferase [Niabella sp.]